MSEASNSVTSPQLGPALVVAATFIPLLVILPLALYLNWGR